MRIGRNTIAKYRKGDPKEFIMDCLKVGWSKSKTVKVKQSKQYMKKDILAPKAMLLIICAK